MPITPSKIDDYRYVLKMMKAVNDNYGMVNIVDNEAKTTTSTTTGKRGSPYN